MLDDWGRLSFGQYQPGYVDVLIVDKCVPTVNVIKCDWTISWAKYKHHTCSLSSRRIGYCRYHGVCSAAQGDDFRGQ
jgi:hypothetical protein